MNPEYARWVVEVRLMTAVILFIGFTVIGVLVRQHRFRVRGFLTLGLMTVVYAVLCAAIWRDRLPIIGYGVALSTPVSCLIGFTLGCLIRWLVIVRRRTE